MVAGDFSPNQPFRARKWTVKSSIDLTIGQVVADDGNGLVLATQALAATKKILAVTESHDYSEVAEHDVRVVETGPVEVLKVIGAIAKGAKVMVSSTPGSITAFVPGDVTSTVNESTVEAANNINLGSIGYCYEAAASDATTAKIILGA